MKELKKFLQMSYKVLHFAIIIIIKLELRKNEWGKAACIANLRDGSNFGGCQRHGLHIIGYFGRLHDMDTYISFTQNQFW